MEIPAQIKKINNSHYILIPNQYIQDKLIDPKKETMLVIEDKKVKVIINGR